MLLVENLEHCDFIALRNMVVRTHLQDLKDVTNNVHYENYRCRKLAGLGNDGKSKLSNKYVEDNFCKRLNLIVQNNQNILLAL
jgi:septin family protein